MCLNLPNGFTLLSYTSLLSYLQTKVGIWIRNVELLLRFILDTTFANESSLKNYLSFFRNRYNLTRLPKLHAIRNKQQKTIQQLTNFEQHKCYRLLRATVLQWFISKTVTSFSLKVFLEYKESRIDVIHACAHTHCYRIFRLLRNAR